MMYFVTAIDMALSAAFWAGIGFGCLLLYHAFRLRVLPWIALYCVLSFLTAEVMHFYFLRLGEMNSSRVAAPPAVSVAGMVSSIIEDTGRLVVALLVLAEIAVLATRSQPGLTAPNLQFLTWAHGYSRELGLTLVFLALALPLPAMISYYTR